jgi:hypothetical protein
LQTPSGIEEKQGKFPIGLDALLAHTAIFNFVQEASRFRSVSARLARYQL